MTIRVYKVAEIVQGKVNFRDNRKYSINDLSAVLTNLNAIENPLPEHAWRFELVIGEGLNARTISVDLPPLLPKSHLPDTPFVLKMDAEFKLPWIVYFRDR